MKIKIIRNTIVSALKIILCHFWQQSMYRFLFIVVITCLFFIQGQMVRAQTIYVDVCVAGPGTGTAGDPYKTLNSAVAAAAPGSNIVMKRGIYPETIIINKNLTLTSNYGVARVGSGYAVGWREVSIPIYEYVYSGCTTTTTNARLYYPSSETGQNTQIAASCDGERFPIVVYAHGRRNDDWPACDDSQFIPFSQDYTHVEGIINPLVRSGIMVISVNWSGLTQAKDPYYYSSIIISTIAYIRDHWSGVADLHRLGLSGHSTGGAMVSHAVYHLSTGQYCDELKPLDITIKALGLIAPACGHEAIEGSDLPSCAPWSVPLLVITGTREHPCQVGVQSLEVYCEAAPPKHLVYITGANHFGYTDDICINPYPDIEEYECNSTQFDPYGLNPRDHLIASPGWDNSCEVGGKSGQEAQRLQQLAAANYLLEFYTFYLRKNDAPSLQDLKHIRYLVQDEGSRCGYTMNPYRCMLFLQTKPQPTGVPVKYFDDLQSLGVHVNVHSCLE